ncbi:MAG: acetyl-CoA carboxylase biotin carboxyl carrier protein [Verrucomicrobiales bacterium]|nr:acetyl-CoA carboxylase biotin carboxyl carrier protein [Verrucomicrobiales bacterium]
MDLKEIRQIIELMKRHDLSLFHLERDGMKIKLKKGVDFDTFVNAVQSTGGPRTMGSPVQSQPMVPEGLLAAGLASDVSETLEGTAAPVVGTTINSPMVGTFYRSPSPGDPPFIKDGDRVEEGMVVCIIEAMKVMNEIKAETSGIIARALVNDGTAIQFGQPLFELK